MRETPVLETERLILRAFKEADLDNLFDFLRDEEVNTFLPWFPVRTREEAAAHLETRYFAYYRRASVHRYAVCLKTGGGLIGYVTAEGDESRDLGYAIARAYWGKGLASEAAGAVAEQLQRDGWPYITATHDVRNPRSGRVMKRLGMTYRYSYEEQWQPKNIPVTFRLYQRNFDGSGEIYSGYWERYPRHFVETDV